MAMEESIGVKELLIHVTQAAIRRTPYLPNLSRIAAKTIEPATGASTWALGSHKWVINRGIFTIKAIIDINHHSAMAF